ncbi:GNAT family N-acetyltransferase [Acinetobacter sp. 194]|uniref:GNAT family N-acetyltransferase n=1 Tax=Acinetobacter shaoyimingii TaxID=2715164 RepID=UPI001407E25E|nr:GNAT family N-acetyltransferase [Acinetobacter shaoyimingii]NHB58425.1 GNAT family N-acetyltransferase [Acinetobacter shaoyimingii]
MNHCKGKHFNFISHLNIRPANLTRDLETLTRLTAQLGYPTPPEQLKQRIETLQQDPKYSTWVAEYQNQIIGYVGLIQQFKWQYDGEVLVIQAFVINEKYRGQGFGKLFLKEIEKIALNKNITSITLNSGNRPERLGAHEFYKKQGFKVTSLGFKKMLH